MFSLEQVSTYSSHVQKYESQPLQSEQKNDKMGSNNYVNKINRQGNK